MNCQCGRRFTPTSPTDRTCWHCLSAAPPEPKPQKKARNAKKKEALARRVVHSREAHHG